MKGEQEHEDVKSGGPVAAVYERRESCTIRVEESVVQYLRELGDGDESQGVRLVVRFHKERSTKPG